MIPNARLVAVLRKNVSNLLVDRCEVWGTIGTPTRTYQQIHANWPCRVEALKPAELVQLATTDGQPVDAYKIQLPYNTTIARDFEIRLNGFKYTVFDVIDDETPLLSKYARVIRA